MADCLYECLREARLEHYYPKLEANGITMAETLSKLTMNDYSSLGISSLEDKKRLFRLIQIIRAVQGPDQPSRSLGQGQSKHQSSQRPTQNKESNKNTSTSRHESKNTHRIQNHERTEPDQNTSQESNKENVGTPKPSLNIPTRTVVVRGAGTSEKKPMLAKKSVPSPAQSDVSVTSSKGLNIVAPETLGKPAGPAFIERIVHNTGYNYGLPNSATKPKTSSVSSSQAADQATCNGETDDTKIKVCVRKRPLSKREIKKKDDDVVRIENHHTVVLVEQKVAVDLTKFTQEHAFIYDEVFHESMTNKEVYERTAKHLIKCVFSGGMATCFVYGQTGAGKTHTIMGNLEVPGLYLLAAQDIFNKVCTGHEDVDVTIWVSYFEIYCGQLFDLLNKRKRLHVREDGSQRVNIAGLSEVELDNVQSLMEAVQHGNKVRSTGASGVNPDSSRSHAVLQIELRNNKKQRIGKISFIDLAGSERAADATDTDKQNRLEGADINQSLLALKECIRALDQESRHTPFRQSKLTHILKDSFIGNCRTCMIANISPCLSASENTLNTLRYADRVKELRKELSPKTTPMEDTAANAKSAITKEFPTVGKMTPSVFHPSSVPLSSTPLRPNKVENAQSECETGYSQFESPICGHKIRPRKLVNALSAEEDKQINIAVKESSRKVCGQVVAEKESLDLTSDKGVSKRVSGCRENKDSVAGKISDVKLDAEKPMDISTSSVNMSTDSRTSLASRASRKSKKPNDKVRNSSSDGAGTKNISNSSRRSGTEVLRPKQGDNVHMDSPLNLSVLKQGKFDKQTGLIARLEKAMEKTREALNRSLTSHDLMAASDMEKDDVLVRGDEAPQLSERQVIGENKPSAKSKSNGCSKDTDVEKSPILVEKFSKSGVLNHPVKSFMQAAKNSPVTKQKMAKLVRAQKEAAGKINSVKKVSRTPTKMLDRPMPDPKVMVSKPDREADTDTSQEVSPSKRRRMVSPPEPQLKTSTDFDDYLAKALHDTGNKRNKFQVYDGKFLPRLEDVADHTNTGAEKPLAIVKKSVDGEGKELSSGVELVPGNDHVDGVSTVKSLNISSDSQTKSPNIVKRSLLSEFRETVVIGTNPKSPVTKTFLSPRKLPGGVGQDLISSSSPMKKFNSERQQAFVNTPTDQNRKYDRGTAYSGFDMSSDKTLTENSKSNGLETSPDMRRPKLLDRDTGDLYTMSQSPQKSPRMAAKISPRMQHLPKPALGQVSEASKKINSLPTPDEFLKSLAGKRSSVRKSRDHRADAEPKSECLDRPKFKASVEAKSESGAVKKDRAKWERPPEHVEPRNSRLLARNQRPTWIKPEATKRLSLTKMLDNPPGEGHIELENDKSDLIQNFYSKLLKYSSKDKVLKDKNSDSGPKSNDVCSTVSDSALLKTRKPSGGKANGDHITEFSEKIPAVSKCRTVTDSGVVMPGLSLEHKKTTETESDVETASIGTLDDVSSIASVRSLPVIEQLPEDTRQIVSEPLPPHPPVDLQKTACSAWKKTAPVKPKPIKAHVALEVSPKKGVKKVTCTAPIRSEKVDPLSLFLPIHPYPVTPSSNDVLTAPKVITKIVVEDDSKDKTGISENLDDSEIVRTLDNATNHKDPPNRDNLVNSLSTIGKALQQSKVSMAKELSKTTNSSHLNRNHGDPLSKTIGYSSYHDSAVLGGARKTERGKDIVRSHDSSQRRNDMTKSGKSLADKDPLRNTIGVSSGKFLTNGDHLSSRSARDSYRWRDPDFYRRDEPSDKVNLNPSLERSFEARQQLGESLRSTYDSVKLRSTLNSMTMTGNGSTLRETTTEYHSRHSTVEYKSNTDGGKSQSHHARLRVISGHEEHLADVTAMCRREMSLLKQVRSGDVSFSDYTNRMTDMLLIKLKSIELLRDRIACCKVIA
ncbi:uncharacterized protein LOC135483337 [Lineus longissimus]|uniref:uncharacterized protein LOC135483337 n=1 Tax=Lineus longissimus TaxID=88925 RepID=UPI002B4E30CF